MTDTSTNPFEFSGASRGPSNGVAITRSSPFVYLASTFWLAFVLSNVAGYSFLQGVNIYYPLIALFLPFFLLFRLRQMIRLGFNLQFWLWVMTVLIPILLYALGQSGADATASLKQRIVFFSLVAGSAVVLGAPDSRRMLRTASLIVLAWTIPISFVELLVPNIFSTAEGRSAGLYENPNAASMAILLCLLFAVDIRRQTTRSLLLMSLGTAAVFTTFSRSGMLFAAALWGFHALSPGRGNIGLRGPQRMIAVGFLALVAMVSVIGLAQRVSLSDEAALRVRSLLTGDVTDASSATRKSVAEDALDLIERNFWGNGLGFADGLERRPHNTYLYVAVDFGIPGVAFYLTLLFFGFRRSLAQGWRRGANSLGVVLLLMYASLFTHYVAGTTFYSVAFAALATGALILPEQDDSPRRRVGQHNLSLEA